MQFVSFRTVSLRYLVYGFLALSPLCGWQVASDIYVDNGPSKRAYPWSCKDPHEYVPKAGGGIRGLSSIFPLYNRLPFAAQKECLTVGYTLRGVESGATVQPMRVVEIFVTSDGASGNVIVQTYGG
jgi:hypothetical protein